MAIYVYVYIRSLDMYEYVHPSIIVRVFVVVALGATINK